MPHIYFYHSPSSRSPETPGKAKAGQSTNKWDCSWRGGSFFIRTPSPWLLGLVWTTNERRVVRCPFSVFGTMQLCHWQRRCSQIVGRLNTFKYKCSAQPRAAIRKRQPWTWMRMRMWMWMGMGVSEIPHSFISIHSISVENRVCAVFSLFTWHENVGVWSESCHSHFKRAASRSQR